MSSKEQFNQISPSEFFYRNRDLAGFSNPTRSLYTAVREFVENSLDACDHSGTYPNIHMIIKAVDPDKPDPKQYILTVKDNGPGIPAKHVPLAFGTVLYGSKFGLKQARGMFGLGATMAILYGQITTNKPVKVKSNADGKTRFDFEMKLDIQKNKPVIMKKQETSSSEQGLSVSICLEGDYAKAGNKIRDYVYQTSLITPYATISFDDPKGEKFNHKAIIRSMPPAPTVIAPHPYGIDVETIRRMLVDTHYQIPNVDDKMIEKVRKELGMSKNKFSYNEIMKKTETYIDNEKKGTLHFNISNRDRSIGAKISGYIASKYGEKGLKKSITLNFKGSAGQSFGCWNANNLNLSIDGDANDYVGKGMNGGRIVIKNQSDYVKENRETVLAGNTCLYGATGGELYIAGSVGERFAVRNSGAKAVVEGTGHHCCEYMTGGHVTNLGPVGLNFGAGMTGGFAYILDEDRTFFDKCNRGLVNLERITTEEMQPHRKHLKEILEKHYKYTKSQKANEILNDFEKFESYFWLVIPAASNIQDLLKVTTVNAA